MVKSFGLVALLHDHIGYGLSSLLGLILLWLWAQYLLSLSDKLLCVLTFLSSFLLLHLLQNTHHLIMQLIFVWLRFLRGFSQVFDTCKLRRWTRASLTWAVWEHAWFDFVWFGTLTRWWIKWPDRIWWSLQITVSLSHTSQCCECHKCRDHTLVKRVCLSCKLPVSTLAWLQ